MPDLDEYLHIAITAARAAGAEMVAALDQPRHARYKGYRDIVTETDLSAERAIVNVIRERFPGHGLCTEESTATRLEPDSGENSEFLWFVDPLDGTTNFHHGLPLFCSSIALRRGRSTLVAAVYDPLREHLFTAQAGGGAWLNGRRLQVSECSQLSEALVALDWARDPSQREQSVAHVSRLAPQVATVRALGSAVLALCGIATGWLEGYFNLALYDWDVAAAELMIREAGGTVTDLGGKPWNPGTRGCLASNGRLQQELLDLLSHS
jgi:myo-inositol-1(or 4)-monophosphatase